MCLWNPPPSPFKKASRESSYQLVFNLQASSGHTWNNQISSGSYKGEVPYWNYSPLLLCESCVCVLISDCWPWGACRALMLPSVASVRSTPHTQAAVSTHDTRRQRMSHFTHSWKEWSASLCHLELLLSAGVWCVEGERLRETPWPGMGPAAATFEVTVGTRSFIFTEKRGKLKGWPWLAHCFVSSNKWLELITICTRPVHQPSCCPRSFKNTALQALSWLLKHETSFNLFLLKKPFKHLT